MARFTKKYMVEDYERLYAHADLLELYLYDTQYRVKPIVEREKLYGPDSGSVRIELYRPTGASGGYVVIFETMPNILYLDQAIELFSKRPTEYTQAISNCLERLRIIRNRMVTAEANQTQEVSQ